MLIACLLRFATKMLAVGAILLGTHFSAADARSPMWSGVWQGSIGMLPVRACLVRRYDGAGAGIYFYRLRLKLIGLEQQGSSKTWREGADSTKAPRPEWQFGTITQELLTGTWSYGRQRLPFRLTRVASNEDEPCGSLAFNAPRLRPLIVIKRRAMLNGVGFTRLTLDPGSSLSEVVKLSTFALDGGDAATSRINARLFAPFSKKPAESMWWDCITGGQASPGMGGDYNQEITPTLITARWLAATEELGYYCGGAHPDGGTTSLTFDRRTGAIVNLNGWLNAAAIEPRPDIEKSAVAIKPALRRLAMTQDKEIDAECRGSIEGAEFWDIGLTKTGLVFTPGMSHALAACANPVTIPWAKLAPYLSHAGRTVRATISVPHRHS